MKNAHSILLNGYEDHGYVCDQNNTCSEGSVCFQGKCLIDYDCRKTLTLWQTIGGDGVTAVTAETMVDLNPQSYSCCSFLPNVTCEGSAVKQMYFLKYF